MRIRRNFATAIAAASLLVAGAGAASAQPAAYVSGASSLASSTVGAPVGTDANNPTQPDGTISHSNTVSLMFTSDPSISGWVQNVGYTYSGQYSIAGGQPWSGVTSNTTIEPESEDSGDLAITAQAGRKNSTGPADWFNANSSSSLGADADHNGSPSQLNFAFTGNLNVGASSYPIVIGQGSNAQGNNWWIGGQGWTSGADGVINSPDGQYSLAIDWDGTTPEANAFTLQSNG